MSMNKKTEKQEMVAYDFEKIQVFEFSNLNTQKISSDICYSCDYSESSGCDSCDFCDHGW